MLCPLSPWTRLSFTLSPVLIPSNIPAGLFSSVRPSSLSHHSSAVGPVPAASTPSQSRACTGAQAWSHVAPMNMHIASKECAFWVESVSLDKYFIFSFARIPRMKNES